MTCHATLTADVGHSSVHQGLESYWLKSTPFVPSPDISIADLLIVTELEQLRLLVGALEVSFFALSHQSFHRV